MRRRLAVALLLLVGLVGAPSAAVAQTGCQFRGGFAQLQALIPERVGACQEDERYRADTGESTQRTSTGTFAWHSVDNALTFSDGASTWVLDPYGQVQVRGFNERLPFEFNGDGFPLVGQAAPANNEPCPTPPLAVLAVENFYASLVQQLGGQCVSVTTILSDADADPHEFEPTADDVRAFQSAQLVIENGLGYDDFADKIMAALSHKPLVVRAGDVLGLKVGANPHVWYSAGSVDQIKAAILTSLKQLKPDGASYFDAQNANVDQAFGTYRGLIAQIAAEHGNTPIGATESIFADMASSTGLQLITPPELMNALSEGGDPAARDLAIFQDQIKRKQINVLVYNVQTVTPITEQLKELAMQNNIPIVGVSESLPVGSQTFQGWQASQLQRLLNALQKSAGR